MALEPIPRCEHCRKQQGDENGWYMGELYLDQIANRLITVIEHFIKEKAEGKKTWCGIPCIQQAIGKELEKDGSKSTEGEHGNANHGN